MKTLGFYIEPLSRFYFKKRTLNDFYGFAPVVCTFEEDVLGGYIRISEMVSGSTQRFTNNFTLRVQAEAFITDYFVHYQQTEPWQFIGEIHFRNYHIERYPIRAHRRTKQSRYKLNPQDLFFGGTYGDYKRDRAAEIRERKDSK